MAQHNIHKYQNNWLQRKRKETKVAHIELLSETTVMFCKMKQIRIRWIMCKIEGSKYISWYGKCNLIDIGTNFAIGKPGKKININKNINLIIRRKDTKYLLITWDTPILQ